MTRSEIEKLIDEVLDGDCSEADFLRLEAELHVDPVARDIYYNRLKLDTALQLESEKQVTDKVVRPAFFQQKLPWIAGLAAAIMVMAGWQLGRIDRANSVQSPESIEPKVAGFGVLAEQSNAEWQTQSVDRGELLPQGTMHLRRGIAQLELFSGVTVILEGESTFELHSAMEMTVHSGKIRAIVPRPARGFKVRTASGDVVDLGTEFALDVKPDQSEVYVLDGEIEWHPVLNPMEKLHKGNARRNDTKGSGESILQSKEFAGLGDIEKRKVQKHDQWLAYTETLKSDPRLLAYYPMTQNGNWYRTLRDETPAKRDGTIVRATRAPDRWHRPNRALDFGTTGSRVRVDIPGEHSELTLYCWVKIGSLDRWYNSLFLTDGHELHEPHWQIMDDGRLFFSVKKRDWSKGKPKLKDKQIAYSPPFWTPQMSGQWIQLATVYSSIDKTITHYLNGEPLSREILSDEYVVDKVRIGAASIGNWSEPYRQDPHFTVRNLNGAIDEFAVFSAALSAEEIAALYSKGKP